MSGHWLAGASRTGGGADGVAPVLAAVLAMGIGAGVLNAWGNSQQAKRDKEPPTVDPEVKMRSHALASARQHGRLDSPLGHVETAKGESLEDLGESLQQLFFQTSPSPREAVPLVLARYDRDNDGYVNLAEGEQWGIDADGNLRTLKWHTEDPADARPTFFKDADTDDDKRASGPEIQKALTKPDAQKPDRSEDLGYVVGEYVVEEEWIDPYG